MSTPDLPLEVTTIATSHTNSISNKPSERSDQSTTPPLVKLKLKQYDSLKINIIKETKSHNSYHSNHSNGHTPLTPLEYDDKLEYTPPSLNHLNSNHTFDHGIIDPINHTNIYHHTNNTLHSQHTSRGHKPDFSLTMPSQQSHTNTMKTRLTLDNQDTSRGFNIEHILTNHSTVTRTNSKSPNDINITPYAQTNSSKGRHSNGNISRQSSIRNDNINKMKHKSTHTLASVAKTLTTLNNHKRHSVKHSTLHSLGFSPFDPMDITAMHPNEINKALNMLQSTDLRSTNSFQQEHITPFAKQNHVDLHKRVSATASKNNYLNGNSQTIEKLRDRVHNSNGFDISNCELKQQNNNINNNDEPVTVETVDCCQGCFKNI
eukprot:246319_1